MKLSDMMGTLEDINDTDSKVVFLPEGVSDWSEGIEIGSVCVMTTSNDETLIICRADTEL